MIYDSIDAVERELQSSVETLAQLAISHSADAAKWRVKYQAIAPEPMKPFLMRNSGNPSTFCIARYRHDKTIEYWWKDDTDRGRWTATATEIKLPIEDAKCATNATTT